jgi:hypothetical protein
MTDIEQVVFLYWSWETWFYFLSSHPSFVFFSSVSQVDITRLSAADNFHFLLSDCTTLILLSFSWFAWLNEESCWSDNHKLISRFEYFQKIFEWRVVLMKQSTVLNAELNFDSNGTPRFSIKNHTEPIKNKNYFFTLKNKGKLRIS